jgi:hypothetical protein
VILMTTAITLAAALAGAVAYRLAHYLVVIPLDETQ